MPLTIYTKHWGQLAIKTNLSSRGYHITKRVGKVFDKHCGLYIVWYSFYVYKGI